jgi:ubiquinone/menaquinone biosynthesis C-methylase UbiE
MKEKDVKNFFRRADPKWWNPLKENGRKWVYLKQFKKIAEILKEDPSVKALDLGAGRGLYTGLLLKKKYKVVSVDINPRMLEIIHQKFGNKVLTIEAGCVNLPFENESFDIILAIELVVHVPEIEKLLSEIKRILRSNGKAILSVTNKFSLYSLWVTKINPFLIFKSKEYFNRQYSVKEFSEILEKYGFQIISIYGFGVIPSLSLLKNWQFIIIPEFFAKGFSSILDPLLGKYFGHILTFIISKKRSP